MRLPKRTESRKRTNTHRGKQKKTNKKNIRAGIMMDESTRPTTGRGNLQGKRTTLCHAQIPQESTLTNRPARISWKGKTTTRRLGPHLVKPQAEKKAVRAERWSEKTPIQYDIPGPSTSPTPGEKSEDFPQEWKKGFITTRRDKRAHRF